PRRRREWPIARPAWPAPITATSTSSLDRDPAVGSPLGLLIIFRLPASCARKLGPRCREEPRRGGAGLHLPCGRTQLWDRGTSACRAASGRAPAARTSRPAACGRRYRLPLP